MGYYTSFTLNLYDEEKNPLHETNPEKSDKIMDWFKEKEIIGYALERDGSSCDTAKWYEYEEDMAAVSKLFPDVLFLLSGEGEESGDLWNHWFKNGKSQRCQGEIIYPAYDESELE